MQKEAQGWFMGGTGSSRLGNGTGRESSVLSSSSLVADWKAYEASKSEFSTPDQDLESAVGNAAASSNVPRSFYLFSKGVKDLPRNFQSATGNFKSGKSLMYFGILLACGMFFVFIAFTMFLPVVVLMPQKFAVCLSFGCTLIVGSFFPLKGAKNQFLHMISKERLASTLAFVGSMVGTIYVSLVLHSYILSVIFSFSQVLALLYYAVSYFPGGSIGLRFLSSALTSSVLKFFGR